MSESDVALKVQLSLNQAIVKTVALNNQWPWLQQTLNSTNWSVNKATLAPSVIDTRFIRYGIDRLVQYETEREFFMREAQPGEPCWYTRTGNEYFFYPYPSTDEQRNQTFFHVIQSPTIPTADSGVFDIPEEYLQLFRLIALSELSIVHLGDRAMAQYYKTEQQEMYTFLKSKRIGVENSSMTAIVEY